MGIIARLINRRIAGQLDNPRRKPPSFADRQSLCLAHGSGQTAHRAADISPDWLRSIRSLGEPGEVNCSRVIVVLMSAPVSIEKDQHLVPVGPVRRGRDQVRLTLMALAARSALGRTPGGKIAISAAVTTAINC